MIDTLGKALDYAAACYKGGTAVVDGPRRFTFSQVAARTNQVARALLAAGNEPGGPAGIGDRVGLLMPNCAEYLFCSFGIWKAGLVWTQLQPLGGPESWAYVLNDARAETLIYHVSVAADVERTKPLLTTVRTFLCVGGLGRADDPDLLSRADAEDDASLDVGVTLATVSQCGYSSGTTGLPKGILWTHGSWMKCYMSMLVEIPELSGGRFMHVGPLTHLTSGFVVPTWLRGGTNVILPGFDPGTWLDTVEREKITATAMVPTSLYMLLDHPVEREHDLSSLRSIIYGGSPIAPQRLRQAIDRLGPVFTQLYGCGEGGFLSVLPRGEHDLSPARAHRLASAGRPVMSSEVRIVDPITGEPVPTGSPGEIAVRSEHRMRSYWHADFNKETIRDDGFVLTGDVGCLDDDGFLYLVDRKKDIVVSGGFNVFPRDVEDVLSEHPAVSMVAVIGVPDPKWGEAVKAFVVRHPHVPADAQELQLFVRERRGSVHAPKSIEFVDSLPLTPTGKPDKKSLRAPYWVGLERSIH